MNLPATAPRLGSDEHVGSGDSGQLEVSESRRWLTKIIAMSFHSDPAWPAVPSLPSGAIEGVAALAERNKILNELVTALGRWGVPLPDQVTARVAAYRHRTTLWNSLGLATMRHIVPVFEQNRIPLVVFKGPLHQFETSGSYFQRPASDIDLLVDHAQFGRASDLLLANGYRLHEGCASPWWDTYLGERHFWPDGRALATIDLHHRTQQPGCPSPRNRQAFLRGSDRRPLGSASVPVLSRTDAALVSAISIVKALIHREHAGAHALDLAVILRASTPSQGVAIENAAQAQGLLRTYLLARRAAGLLVGDSGETSAPDPLGSGRWFGDDVLAGMLLTPDDPNVRWPKRRSLLWLLSDGGSVVERLRRYGGELAWAGAAELSRRRHNPTVAPTITPGRA